MKLRTLPWLLRRSVLAAFDDNCFAIAKGAAYSALLAFFPVLASTAAILVQTRSEVVSQTLEKLLSEIVPPGTESLVAQQFRVSGARPVYLLIAAGLISLWAASGVIKSLIEGFQSAYRVPRNRGVLHHNLLAMSLVILVAVPLIAASLLILFGGQVERMIFHDATLHHLAFIWRLISRVARYLIAFLATALVTSLLYYFGPYRKQRWNAVWRGGVLASIGWLLATSGFGWYVRNIAQYNVMYGSVGAGIALLVWMYLMAIIALIGCEFNAEYERAAWK